MDDARWQRIADMGAANGTFLAIAIFTELIGADLSLAVQPTAFRVTLLPYY